LINAIKGFTHSVDYAVGYRGHHLMIFNRHKSFSISLRAVYFDGKRMIRSFSDPREFAGIQSMMRLPIVENRVQLHSYQRLLFPAI